jgi:hypothetical protein
MKNTSGSRIPLHKRVLTPMVSLELARKAVEASHAASPQYKGHWDDYVLVVVRKKITTKMGLAFEKGDVTLAAPALTETDIYPPLRAVYSQRNHIDVLLDPDDVIPYQP